MRPLRSSPANDESVSRFIFSSRFFSATKSQVKGKAFEPSDRDNSTSVFRIIGLTEEQIWYLGHHFVAQNRTSSLRARADVSVSVINNLQLRLVPDEPPPRHANITGWPEEKDRRMSLAQLLAAEATLVLEKDA